MADGGSPEQSQSLGLEEQVVEEQVVEDHELSLAESTAQKRAAEDMSDRETGEATDDSGKAESSPPPRKKAKLGSLDAESPVSDDVDEGEIIELSSTSGDKRKEDESGQSSDEKDPASPICEQPKISQGWNKGVSSGLRTSFGPSPGLGLSKLNRQTGKASTPSGLSGFLGTRPSPTQTQTTESHKSPTNPSNETPGNSNSPIMDSPANNTGDMDTSEPPAQSKAERQKNAPFTREQRQKMEIAIQALTHKELKPFIRDKHPWVLPVMSSEFQIGAGIHLNWCLKFEEWCKDFLSANREHLRNSPARIERFVWDAYQQYTENLPTLSKPNRRSIKAAATEVRQQGKLRELIITALGEPRVLAQNASQASVPPNASTPTRRDETSELGSCPEGARTNAPQDVEMSESSGEMTADPDNPQERSVIRRYYPGISEDADFCITCASPGHRTGACPEKTCRFCQGAHFFYACPTRRRCQKCQQLGHTKATCKEKLALAPGEEGFMECAFCQGADHYEDKCIEIWRTYHPDLQNVHKVNKLPVFCYSCGQQGHYGGDCGVQELRGDNNPKETWTQWSLNIYIDSQSTAVALVYENGLPIVAPPPGRPDIPGRSIVPQTHIFFDDSDDEADNNFIKAPVQRQQGPGQIRIASNIDFTSQQSFNAPNQQADDPHTTILRNGDDNDLTQKTDNRRRRGGRTKRDAQTAANPPLPPGPPPSEPAPAHAPLPPRPSGPQNNNANPNPPKRSRHRQRPSTYQQLVQQQQGSNYQGQGNGRQQGQGQGPPRGGGGSNRGRGGFSSALGGGRRPRRGGT